MCHWKKWIWPGILTALVLSALALWMKTDFIQSDLTAKAESALEAKGHSWAGVDMAGRDATLFGDAPSEAAQIEAAKLTDGAYEVRVVDNQTKLLAAQSPYILNAKRDDTGVALTGFIPNEAMRETILDQARKSFPNSKISDAMTLARGAPKEFGAIAGFGFSQLAGLTKGEMGLSDTKLSLKGAATDRDTYNTINSTLEGSLPSGAVLAMKKITAPAVSPYTWSADYTGNKLTLNGHVPSMDAAKSVIAAAKAALPKAQIVDQQLVAPGEPKGFADASTYALQQLPRFSNGKVGLSDLDLSVSGVALSSGKYTAALGAVGAAALPAGYALAKANIVPATISPYTWAADYDGSAVKLTGFVPDTKARASVIAATKKSLPAAKITDAMQIAAGAPEGFVNAARFASNQLTRFSSGSVSLSNRALAVKGVAKTSASYKAAKIAISSGLPGGMTLASENIAPPTISPYTWAADYDGSAVKLTGFVPDTKARASVLAATKKSLPGAKITDAMQIAAGAPKGFVNAARFASNQLNRFSSGSVSLSNRALAVKGVAKTSASYKAAKIAISSGLPGDMTLASENIVPPTVNPYTWGANYKDNMVVLTGYVPNNKTRAGIIARAKKELPSAKITDQMLIAAGAPNGFQAVAEKGLSLLPGLAMGNARIIDKSLVVNGTAKSVNSYDGVIAAKGNIKGTIKPVTMDPFTWSIVKGTDKAVISGFVPSRGVGDDNLAKAKAVLKKPVEDRQRVAGGAPSNFKAATTALIVGVNRLDNSSGSLTGTNAFIQGRASSPEQATLIGNEIGASIPKNFKYRRQISYPLPKPAPPVNLMKVFVPKVIPEPPAPKVTLLKTFVPKPVPAPKIVICQVDFPTLFGGEKIHFDTARAIIKEESFDLLNRIAKGLKECPNSKIEVGGHTDSRGSEGYNQGLSEARAQSVIDFMTQKGGVLVTKMIPKGYGEMQPIAPNTRADRSKNRRIEFKSLSQ